MLERTASSSWLIVAALSTLVTCGDGDVSGGDSADANPSAPGIDAAGGGGALQARIVFPPPSATTADHIEVRGTAAADESIGGVFVGDVAASSDDGFATWRADVPLALGANDLTVDVEVDGAGRTTGVASVAVERWATEADGQRGAGGWPGRMLGVGFDRAGNRAIVSDDVVDGVFGIDAATGDRAVLSDSESTVEVGSGFEIVRPTDLAVRGDTAWVADGGVLVAIDLISGDRVALAEPGGISGVAADPDSQRVVVLAGGSLQDVDSTSGALSPIAGSGPSLDGAFRMDVDWSSDRAVALFEYSDDVIVIDLSTGARSILPNASDIEFSNPAHVAAVGDGTALVWSDQQLVRVDLDTGARALVSGPGVELRGVQAMAGSPLGVIVVEYVPDWEDAPRAPMLIAVDPADGTRVVLAR